MKITKITIQGFRAFDEPFLLDLKDGKNLLLHGENGAGKSSLYMALRRFMEERGDDINRHRNQFSDASRTTKVTLHLPVKDAAGNTVDRAFDWEENLHPLVVPANPATAPISPAERSVLVDTSRRAGFIDYRVLLRTHLMAAPYARTNVGPSPHVGVFGTPSTSLAEQLFDLVACVILDGVRVPVSGGTEPTIGALARRVWERRPRTLHKRNLDAFNLAANAFNAAFNAKLPEVQTKLSEYLGEFSNHHLEITLPQVAVRWDRSTRTMRGAELVPQVKFRGRVFSDYHDVLNEARLSALALCLFFAGVALSDNDQTNDQYCRLLVLDDALIGLELQNRLPVLKILQRDEFKHYQRFMLTHDRVWFDLAKETLTTSDNWFHRELLATEDGGRLTPMLKPSPEDLQRARAHLAAGDYRAAALFARSAFEAKLRSVCQDEGIEVKYKKDHKKISADALWSGIESRQQKREADRARGATVADFIPAPLVQRVNRMRSTILNQLSHAAPPNLGHADVQEAIDTVQQLCQNPFA